MMINRKKTAAMMLGLTMSMTGNLMAAPASADEAELMAAAGETDLQARIEALEAQQRELLAQLETLKQQAGEAKKVEDTAKANKEEISELKKLQDKVKLYGFVRASWDNDSDRNKGDIYDDEKTNSRFYLNLMADMKINKEWTGHLQSETNQRYARSTLDGHYTRDDGTVQRIWLEGNLKNGLNINVGRKWSFLGNQFSLLGATTDGIDVSYPVTKNGLRAGGFYYAMGEYSNADFNFYGPFVKGPIGHNFDIFLAYARLNKGRTEAIEAPYNPGDYSRGNWIGNQAFVISAATNVLPHLRATVDYVRTNHKNDLAFTDPTASYGDCNQSWFARLDYKGTNLDQKGSWGAYVRYHNIGRNGTIWNDDAWGSVLRNSKGWSVGVKYVPWKNVEWENMFEIADCNKDPYPYGVQPYKRHLFRTQIDFHF